MNNICNSLHRICTEMERFTFPFDTKKIHLNGIYILFEKGEKAHGGDRIVRIGTHTGVNQLRSRLQQHFIKENKDRSIFRKNIGRALLNREGDPFLEQWNWDLTTRKAKEQLGELVDRNKQTEMEKEITSYIQANFSFIVFEVQEKKKRLSIESKIISTVSLCDDCSPSPHWFGSYSPNRKIRESGLWQVNELYKDPVTESDLDELKGFTLKSH